MSSEADQHADEAPTWDFFRACMEDGAPERSEAWKLVGCWAVDRLSKGLGEEWPQLTFKALGQLPAGMELAGAHTSAYTEFVELALWRELLRDREGFADAWRPLKGDPRPDVVPHVRLQFEVGALALAAGHGVRFERPVSDSGKTSDVTIDLEGGGSLLVEGRVVLQDQATVAINRFSDRVHAAIRDLCMSYDVDCSGDLTKVWDDDELAGLLELLEGHAGLVRIGAAAPPVNRFGASLQVSARESLPDRALRGPQLTGDLWPRIAERLEQKADQTEGGENVWIRITLLQGFWMFTHWGQLSLTDKLATMRRNVAATLAARPHVRGVVVSSASAWPHGTIDAAFYGDGAGGFAIRSVIPPIRARETLVIPLSPEPRAGAHGRMWRDLYVSEPDWLDHALHACGLPPVAEIFAAPG